MTMYTTTPVDSDADQVEDPVTNHNDRLFCYSGPCMCHEDQERVEELNGYYQEGLVSANDADNIYNGRTL